jgi:hypothetical protein
MRPARHSPAKLHDLVQRATDADMHDAVCVPRSAHRPRRCRPASSSSAATDVSRKGCDLDRREEGPGQVARCL